jgi:WD40 repeat protein
MNRPHHRLPAAVLITLAAMLAAPALISADGPPQAPILRLELGMHSARISQIGTDTQGRFLIAASRDKTARLWDASNGQLLRVFRVPSDEGSNNGKLYACALSPDGRIVAVGGYDWQDTVYIFDRQSGQMIRRMTGLGNSIERLQFTSDGEFLAAVLLGKGGCDVWRTRDWSLLGNDDAGDDTYSLDLVRRDGAWFMAAASDDGKLRCYRLKDQLEKLFEYDLGEGRQPDGISFNPDGSLLAVGYSDSRLVQVFSVSSKGLTPAYTPDLSGCTADSLFSVRFSQDGATLSAGGMYNSSGVESIRTWSKAGKGPYRDLKTGGTTSTMDIEAMPGGGFLVAGADPFWAILDSTGAVSRSIGMATLDFWIGRNEFRLGPGGKAASFNGRGKSVSLVSFDTTTRSSVSMAPPADWYLADTTSFKVEKWKDSYGPTLDGKALAVEKYEYTRSLAIAPNKKQFVLGTAWNLYLFDRDGKQLWKQPVPGNAWSVNISDDGALVVATVADGTIRWYRLSDGQPLLAFFPHPDGKRWVLWTPSGYYDASPGGEDLIGWQMNNGLDAGADFFPAARFRGTYYRPDVVNLVLATLDEARALSAANSDAGRRQDAGSILDKRPPIVTITSPDQGSAFNAGTLTVRYRVRSPSDAPVTTVRALVDGRPIDGAKGLTVVSASDGDQDLQLNLPSRDCTVSLIAENRNGPSDAASVKLLWKGAAPSQDEFVIKPKLYVLSVGVSAYQKPEYHLNYSAKDARDFAALLAKGSPLYRGVETRVLADADANKDDILDGLDWIQKQTTSKDVAVILFSGHGINDSNGNYYYLPVEADVDRLKRTGVPFSDIKTTVSSIAGKVLFFIDTCHSGNLMAGRRAAGTERDIVGVINELASAENGAVVFASSTGSQYSYEDPAWGNGAFTKALLEGLGGAAAYGQGGRVTVNMLDLYLSERVKELTGGKQTPTTTKPPNVPDFPVAVKR